MRGTTTQEHIARKIASGQTVLSFCSLWETYVFNTRLLPIIGYLFNFLLFSLPLLQWLLQCLSVVIFLFDIEVSCSDESVRPWQQNMKKSEKSEKLQAWRRTKWNSYVCENVLKWIENGVKYNHARTFTNHMLICTPIAFAHCIPLRFTLRQTSKEKRKTA